MAFWHGHDMMDPTYGERKYWATSLCVKHQISYSWIPFLLWDRAKDAMEGHAKALRHWDRLV